MQLLQHTTHKSALATMERLTCDGTTSWAAVLQLGQTYYAADPAGINHLQQQGHDPAILEEREEAWVRVSGGRYRVLTEGFVKNFFGTYRLKAPRAALKYSSHILTEPRGSIQGYALTEKYSARLYWVEDTPRKFHLGCLPDAGSTVWRAVGRGGLSATSAFSPEKAVANLQARETLLHQQVDEAQATAPDGVTQG